MALSCAVAYVLFHAGALDWLQATGQYGYLSIFMAGLFFSFGFTTPFAIAMFIELSPFVHPVPAAIIAGGGALISDFLIFDILRFSAFAEEFDRLRATRAMTKFRALLTHSAIPERVRRAVLFTCAGLVIASPLPDELGVSLVSGLTTIRPRAFGAVCFLCNAGGILLFLLAGRLA